MKEVTVEELHRETDRWVKEATSNGGIVITDHGSPVADLVQHGLLKRPRWLQERLAARDQLPFMAADSAVYISEDRERP
jgi:antitoxin (DNA-binding transcriptional repressor) of toxin-antitoxin stability system